MEGDIQRASPVEKSLTGHQNKPNRIYTDTNNLGQRIETDTILDKHLKPP